MLTVRIVRAAFKPSERSFGRAQPYVHQSPVWERQSVRTPSCFPESYGAAPTLRDENKASGAANFYGQSGLFLFRERRTEPSAAQFPARDRRIYFRPRRDWVRAVDPAPYVAESRSFGRRQTSSRWIVRAAPPSGKQAFGAVIRQALRLRMTVSEAPESEFAPAYRNLVAVPAAASAAQGGRPDTSSCRPRTFAPAMRRSVQRRRGQADCRSWGNG
jgi:hypothetical protein